MIFKATDKNIEDLLSLALKLWKDNSYDCLKEELLQILKEDKNSIFLYSVNNEIVGFSQVSLRYDYVEGTDSSPVAYLEGIYIKENYRNLGYAKQLLKECENWAREKGCSEFASDCELKNDLSLEFYLKMGFSETNKIICFKKQI